MFALVLECCFWVGFGLFSLHHFLYPLIIERAAMRRMQRLANTKSAKPEGGASRQLPHVTMIVPAHNEARFIEQKLQNLSQLDYPAERFTVVLALDGCSDATLDLATRAAATCPPQFDLQIIEYETNIGKLSVLNEQISRATSAIIALSDTSALIGSDALRRAAEHFEHPQVGFVAATYRMQNAASEGERAYYEYLTHIRRNEAMLDSPLGVHGSLYFFRRALWEPLDDGIINDDFILPLKIAAKGYRGVYDPLIVSEELERTAARQDFSRRIRLGAGNMQQTLLLWKLADPRRPWLAFMFVFGKGLRAFMPFLVILAATAAGILALAGSIFYAVLFCGGLAVVALGAVAACHPNPKMPRALAWLGYLVEGYTASFLGSVRYLQGKRITSWQRTRHRDEPQIVPITRWTSTSSNPHRA